MPDLSLTLVLPLAIAAVVMLFVFFAIRRATAPIAGVRRMLGGGDPGGPHGLLATVFADRDGDSVPDALEHMRLADAAPSRETMPMGAAGAAPRYDASPSRASPTDALEELRRLLDRRLITHAEYEEKKREILARM
ncbi:MAG TPA: hypothetical protein VFQ45_00840 [Longimicrobium sp.]|nr:hypothetical protein [Longimicrobium sp.]